MVYICCDEKKVFSIWFDGHVLQTAYTSPTESGIREDLGLSLAAVSTSSTKLSLYY